jgi:serine protease AprX
MSVSVVGGGMRSLRFLAIFAVIGLLVPLLTGTTAAANAPAEVRVIVTAVDGSSATAARALQEAGGRVEAEFELIGGVAGTVAAAATDRLRNDPAVATATHSAPLQLNSAGWDDGTGVDPNPQTYVGSVNRVAGSILQVDRYWSGGHTGAGVDVALIDSGVVPVNGLTWPGKVINGPDLSFESQSDEFRHLDTFGHGTHMASIIAGRDDGSSVGDANAFMGVAPDARIVSVKVAGHDGATDVSQVIAAIDWVVQHKNDNDLNIRVLNLSFGTDSTQSYLLDPLAYAVEQAWNNGIVVVVAVGNDGNAAALRNPALDPFVIAVGATNSGTTRTKINSVMSFSNCGDDERHVDVAVPGESIAGLAAPGSDAADDNPHSVVGGRYMLGSGTSQAAAFVSGAAALILDRSPEATPDQVKALLMETAGERFRKTDPHCYGAGVPNLEWANHAVNQGNMPNTVQSHLPAMGRGSLEESRGSDHLENDDTVLEGEQDIFGNGWEGTSWSSASAYGTSWSGGDWNGTSWSGTSWSGTSWSGTSWSGTSWSGTSWSGTSWSDKYWNGTSWSGTSWSGTSWSGTSWSGTSWSGLSWGRPAAML